MKKSDAIALFDGRIGLAEAIQITPQAVSAWPDELSERVADRVIAAAVRQGKFEKLQQLLGTAGAARAA